VAELEKPRVASTTPSETEIVQELITPAAAAAVAADKAARAAKKAVRAVEEAPIEEKFAASRKANEAMKTAAKKDAAAKKAAAPEKGRLREEEDSECKTQ
jgi:hypothetical protein